MRCSNMMIMKQAQAGKGDKNPVPVLGGCALVVFRSDLKERLEARVRKGGGLKTCISRAADCAI